jgi:hypothetical protein|tara:strand:+ start:974 stop:1228 length:255 start_codon:yes stop_codon:yes gene_type:complete
MSSLISISVKGKDGNYKSYTISVSNETNKFGQNVSMYIEQTQEEREQKKPRTYIGNGKVIWTDGIIKTAERNDVATDFADNSDE